MKEIHIRSVAEYNKRYNLDTLHPLISVVNFDELPPYPAMTEDMVFTYDVYAIFLKQTKNCSLRYGHSTYDYEEGTIIFVDAGQSIRVVGSEHTRPNGWALLFHPDLLHGTSLSGRMAEYSFFSYTVHEALHMSTRERHIIQNCLEEIAYELEHAIDKHSKRILVAGIEMLLNHSRRFYDRQFITREVPNQGIMSAFKTKLDELLQNDELSARGTPSVAYFAEQLHLSPGYFGDLVKSETGATAQEHIQLAVIERAKELLSTTTLSISEVAYRLGFTYPNHFSRLFRSKTGETPKHYRMAQ